MSIIPLAYSPMTAMLLYIFTGSSNHVLIAVAIASLIIGFALLLGLFFRICVL